MLVGSYYKTLYGNHRQSTKLMVLVVEGMEPKHCNLKSIPFKTRTLPQGLPTFFILTPNTEALDTLSISVLWALKVRGVEPVYKSFFGFQFRCVSKEVLHGVQLKRLQMVLWGLSQANADKLTAQRLHVGLWYLPRPQIMMW